MPIIRLFTALCLTVCATTLSAQDSTACIASQHTIHRDRAGQVTIGYTDILDTYLSQEKFTGTEFGYLSQSLRRRDSSRLVRETVHHALVAVAGTRGNDNSLLTLLYNLRFGWLYRWHWAAPRLTLLLGGVVDGTLGGAYDTRNSNNPAQARLALSIDPTARLSWQLRTGRHPLALHYDVTMPLVGMAFSPNYGQSYYEIFSRGYYDHNIVCTSPFSAVQLYQHLSVDFRLWRTTFRVGYLGEFRQMKANNLKYHQYSHSITLGWCY